LGYTDLVLRQVRLAVTKKAVNSNYQTPISHEKIL